MAWQVALSTEAGDFIASYTTCGLSELTFPGTAKAISPTSEMTPEVSEWTELTRQALESCLAGRQLTSLPPLDWTGSTAFQQQVWRALQSILLGQTATYREIAELLGVPGGARAVGTACGANPIPVLVPCHRVLAKGGKLGGFSGGLDWKRRLLAVERTGLGDF